MERAFKDDSNHTKKSTLRKINLRGLRNLATTNIHEHLYPLNRPNQLANQSAQVHSFIYKK